jgi:acetyltransferase-like isoleucine patch superfamily enzyme
MHRIKIIGIKLKNFINSKEAPFFTSDLLKYQILKFGWSVGKYSYGAPDVLGGDIAKLHIGLFCSIAGQCTVILSTHNYRHASTYPFQMISSNGPISPIPLPDPHAITKGDVWIGNDVLIGRHTTIMPGCVIGDGAVITNSSVVTQNVPPYAIVGGIPAKIIKFRFNPEQIKSLLEVRWWDLPESIIFSNKEIFQLEINEFLVRLNELIEKYKLTK